MTIEQILPLLANRRKGTIITLLTQRPAKVLRTSAPLTKVSTYQVRIGHDYENQKSTIAAREEGMGHRAEEDDYAKRLNEHLSFNKENGRVYLSCQPIDSAIRSAAFVEADGTVLLKADVLNRLQASEKRDSSQSLHLRVPIDTIVELR
jgi:hypothetical protein